ncbi:purine biosynthesis protein PurH [Catenisphaera adipataccumulans]|jgi:hypothetical protein|uniref:Purine biosynthesis protein PurH n=1 Tax=Catenisphaera adipataccumulans TaxID=700500 RepID=A0A7W8CXT0_9FIRM|nr:purine biosynthesis protein PurH [Catenisphaera adipataccumulans]MBB5182237.1 hypothetical protein [Catenisphaera adipataccumulans]
MKSVRIKDTTRAEREEIVRRSLGNIDGLCDSCACGIIKMYDEYIEGKKELSEINRTFDESRLSK